MSAVAYATAQEVRDILSSLDTSKTLTNGVTYDTLFDGLILKASEWFDVQTNRPVGAYAVSAAVAKTFGSKHVYYGDPCVLLTGEMAAAPTIVAVSVDGTLTYTPLAAADWYAEEVDALTEGHPYTTLKLDTLNGSQSAWPTWDRSIQVTAKFGFSTVAPYPVKQAVSIQALRFFKRGQFGYQDKPSFQQGQMIDSGYSNNLDQDLERIIKLYRRVAI